ncbi:MAG: peptidoglycan DD-metalloendopeptidase family protein [Deltaproteobacteria bacterium]|nr:peptidoglycan DD-metalloendopeptidase family protein [Deltaproteobacteria bacterium]
MSLFIVVFLALGALGACGGGGNARRPKAPTRPLPGLWHRVVSGESVLALARRYEASLQDIEEINGIDRRDPLVAGKMLFIPRDPQKTASSEPTSGPTSGPTSRATAKLRWPVPAGRLTSTFGRRGKRVHEGIDIAAPEGTPVLAAADGTVIYAGSGIKGYGNLVILRHTKRLVTVYAHNRRNLVHDGQHVSAGDTIAEVGKTGRATGFHVHFEVRAGEKAVDPLRYVQVPKGNDKGKR